MTQIHISSNAPYGAQFALMRLQARNDATTSGTEFNLGAFSVRIPTTNAIEANQPSKGVEKGEPIEDYVFQYLGSENSLKELVKFDVNGDGAIGSSEYDELYKKNLSDIAARQDGVAIDTFSELGESLNISEEIMMQIFEQFDDNDDGILSPDELKAAMEHIAQEREKEVEQKVQEILNDNQSVDTKKTETNLRSQTPFAKKAPLESDQ